ncbi:hypothetical protein EDB82DRAFT_469917 [Fusarium venenatum]|uniref:uncharacterized protein n=1 Tax=Fusarium venenatum TaxID=56646 RepID=UPI001DA99E66|nr:hypothetical protein EDB82DRAFT_469917 [Fusarium venenatum]
MTNSDSTDNDDMDDDISTDDPSESMSIRDLPGPDNFPAWLESKSKLFWISGKRASGKSSLMKFLATISHTIEHLKSWQRNTQFTDSKLHIITHFFWKPGQLLQRNTQGMLLSLLHEVLYRNPFLAQRLCKDLENVFDKQAYGDWNEAKEFETLSWPDRGDTQVIRDLLRLINVKLCASSREEHPFTLFFEGHPRLKIHLLTYGDIYRFARKRLEISGLDSANRAKILQTVVEKANGVFLWVVLVLDSLNRAIRSGTASADELQVRLAQTPADLTNLLIDMWERSGDDTELSSYMNDASHYLNLVVTASKVREDLLYADERNPMHSLILMASAL